MATQFEIDCALMAGRAYLDTRDRLNWFPVTLDWAEFNHQVMPGGFEAVSFQRGAEIVISYAGTGPGLTDWDANSGLALGFGSEQLRQAAAYYLEVKSANPSATISFTGHSLGGGLAALMGVMFDERAVTFDQAPFANSASTGIRDDLITYLHGQGYDDSQLAALVPELLSYDGYGTRTTNVTGYFVQGEALQLIQPPFSVIGSQTLLAQNSIDLGLSGPVSLHSQALLTAFLENDTFRAITFKLPDLLKMVFDEALYARDPSDKENPQRNFLEHLIRHQTGVTGSFAADAMLDRFTVDLQKVAQAGGFTLTNQHVANTLVAFAMQFYYENADAAVIGRTLYTDVTGGIRFDRTDVSASLADTKGWQLYFQNWLAEDLSLEEHRIVLQLLPAATDWFIQAGSLDLNATADISKAFMVGGTGNDWMAGGSEADLLIGNVGDDTLNGGVGNDTLMGGAGFDTYLINPGDGFDTVLDSDGQGVIKFGIVEAKGSTSVSPNKWYQLGSDTWTDQTNGITYTRSVVDGETQLLVHKGDSNVLVKGWSDGELGIALGAGSAPVSPVTTRTYTGDQHAPLKSDGTYDWSATAWLVDGALAGGLAEANFNDVIYGSVGADRMDGLGGNDALDGGAGADRIDGGDGDDLIGGGAGSDLIYGGIGNDVILSATGLAAPGRSKPSDVWNPPAGTTVWTEGRTWGVYQNADGFTISGGGSLTQDDALDVIYAGDGNDHATGGRGDDFIDGGNGNDTLWGNGGNDIIDGGAGDDLITGDGTTAAGFYSTMPATLHGDDILIGGAGKDKIWGGGGHDLLLGGTEDDTLYGEAGDDVLDGGMGADYLAGAEGNDVYLNVTGEDTISDRKGANTIKLAANAIGGAGLTASVETNEGGQQYMQVQIDLDSGGALKVDSPFEADGTTTLEFASGEVFDLETLVAEQLFTPLHLLMGASGGRLFGGAGDDILEGGGGDDTLLGYAGDDTLWGKNGADILDGGTGSDDLFAGAGDDSLFGGSGDDNLYGGDGHDTLDGGAGSDTLDGGEGNDTYLFGLGSGQDVITSWAYYADIDTIRMGPGITPEDVVFARTGDDLTLSIMGAADSLAVSNWAYGPNYRVERIEFADGVVWDAAYLQERFAAIPVTGTEGDDGLYGGEGDNILDGLAGADVLDGGVGNDVFLLRPGSGEDTIVDIEGRNRVEFATGIDLESLTITRGERAYRIAYGVGDSVIVPLEWAKFPNEFSFADRSYVLSSELFNGIPLPMWGDESDNLLVDLGPGVEFWGGPGGDDTLIGGAGDNVYDFELGDWSDAIVDLGGVDTLKFGEGITPDDLYVEYGDLNNQLPGFRIYVGSDGDVVSIQNGEFGVVEKFQFSDGLTLTFDEMLAWQGGLHAVPAGTICERYGEKLIVGTNADDELEGGDGFAYLGGQGDDSIEVSARTSSVFLLNQGDGNDTIRRLGGDYEETGPDVLVFSAGIAPESLSFSTVSRTVTNYSPFFDPPLYTYTVTDTVIHYGSAGDSVTMQRDSLADLNFMFADGRVATYSSMTSGISVVTVGSGPGRFDTPPGDDAHPTVCWRGMAGDDTYVARDMLSINGQAAKPQRDFVDGGNGGDYIATQAGNDWLTGGRGNDLLEGGTGSDVYAFAEGDGEDTIRDAPAAGEKNYVLITGAVAPTFEYDGSDLLIRYNGGADVIRVEQFFPSGQDEHASISGVLLDRSETGVHPLEIFYSLDDIKAAVNIQNGGSGDDTLTGGDAGDCQYGNAGNDFLSGGAGNDTYVFNRGDGQDGIDDLDVLGAVNTLRFGADIADTDVVGFRMGDDVVLKLKSSIERVGFIGYYGADTVDGGVVSNRRIDRVEFGNGVVWDQAMIQAAVDRAANNRAPTPYMGLPVLQARAGDAFSYAVPADAIIDPDVGDSIVYGVSMLDGSPLPAWLAFDAATRTLSGTPEASGIGSLQFVLWGSDDYGVTVGQLVALGVSAMNHAPVLSSALPDQAATEGTAFSYTVAADAFSDPDADDSLTYSATLADGSALPAWLGFDAATRTFSGTPSGPGAVSVRVTVKDLEELTTSDVFELVVAGTTAYTTLNGTSVSEILNGTSSNDVINGLAGDDVIHGNAGDDIITGGPGNDTLNGGAGNDLFLVKGDSGPDTVNGGDGFDEIRGSEGNDVIRFTLYNGANTVERIDGGAGDNRIVTGAWFGNMDFSATELVNIARIEGGAGSDQISGSQGDDVIDGGGDADRLWGNGGNDLFLVKGDSGSDTVNGGDGFDEIRGSGGDDVIRFALYNGANTVERIDGGAGDNRIVTGAWFGDMDFSTTELVNIARIEGGAGDDRVGGSQGDDIIDGGGGADRLWGNGGNDLFLVAGDSGSDTVNGGDGFDEIRGSGGDDIIRFFTYGGANTVERIDGGAGDNRIASGAWFGNMDFSATELVNIARIEGGAGDDQISGSQGDDVIFGGTGADRIAGGRGNDAYILGRGDGMDTVIENDATAGNTDVAQFLSGVGTDQIWFKKVGNDLETSIIGTADKLVIKDWYLGSAYHVEQFQTTDGAQTLLDSNVANLVNAMASFAPPAAGQTTLSQTYRDALAGVIAANWQ